METVNLESFNIFGKKRKGGTITFDIENSIVIANSGKKLKVVDDYEFTYKIQKTQIKASGGIKGLLKFIGEINTSDSPFNPAVTEMFIEM